MSKTPLLVPAGLLAFAAVAAFALVQPARADEKSYNLSGFSEVAVSAGVDVVLKQGPFSVVASGNKQAIDRLELEVQGSKLSISQKSRMTWFGRSEHNVVTVTAPTFAGISASAGAAVEADGLKLADVRLAASGGADLKASNVTAAALNVSASGGADVKLSGTCTGVTATVSGGADYSGGDMKCQTADIRASGGADAEAWASASAKGRASSGADIHFRGNPPNVDKESSGGGSVKSS